MIIEPLHLRLDSLLDNALLSKGKELQIHGTSSPLLIALLLAYGNNKNIKSLPHVIICSGLPEAQRLKQLIYFFDPQRKVFLLESFDVGPYSGLYPKETLAAHRAGFLQHALEAGPLDIFICPVEGLLQKTIPYSLFKKHSRVFHVGDELPSDLNNFLFELGYRASPLVEDIGHYSIRGGIVDIYSPYYEQPLRIELFGDQIESIRFFSTADQRSQHEVKKFYLTPAKEYLFHDEYHEKFLARFKSSLSSRKIASPEADELIRALVLKQDFPGIDFVFHQCFTETSSVLDYFSSESVFWYLDPLEILRTADEFISSQKSEFQAAKEQIICPDLESIYQRYDELRFPKESLHLSFSNLVYLDEENASNKTLEYKTFSPTELQSTLQQHPFGEALWLKLVHDKISDLRNNEYRVFIFAKNRTSAERLKLLLDKSGLRVSLEDGQSLLWDEWESTQARDSSLVHIIVRGLSESLRLPEERLLFLRDDDFFGKKARHSSSAAEDFQKNAKRLSFGDLKVGDYVVHVKHGIGTYEGLRLMSIGGVESEYIQVAYKDKDKLYLPVYRVGQLQKYAGATASIILDKLGGSGWEKTTAKVKKHLKDIASELIQLYAKRAEIKRTPLTWDESDVIKFENNFPFEETEDQLRALRDITRDFQREQPMDRLVCGDVGFGKTEVAMRAAFLAIEAGKQVAVLAPTTVLTFQHFETFKKRFAGWPIGIRVLNRFVSTADVKKCLQELKDGKVDLVIGTHKLLASNIEYKNLGLLVIDEEQKFGVTHKEKIKKLKVNVDTLTLSATPIPRTLNMSLVGIRDLSIINTAPVDRLPTRTFITKFDAETIRKACESEISRGGQVYFIHNRVHSIYGVADEIRTILPKARIRVAHGQMEEHELEKAMLEFFHHEIDILVCTAIVESGMDVSRANTMFIDDAHMFGLSQLYQLRGRVGRSKTRAYCYLLMPKTRKLDPTQQERLKIIQENTALGSGLKIAQYDLELRGSGNILGEDQSGHVNAVGYEMYMDLLAEALADAKGETVDDRELDPEINLRVPAMIPDSYIKDIRIRLGYYKALADIKDSQDLDQIESELRDQFGEIPEPTLNLMGLMLIRKQCKDLGVRDVSAGVKTISLIFTEKTRLKPETIIKLAMRENKKYSITPDNRLNVRMNTITWQSTYEELDYLCKLI
ncbi:MAG: transcription-repair coupling factor [Bdellovibrionia bacterium]